MTRGLLSVFLILLWSLKLSGAGTEETSLISLPHHGRCEPIVTPLCKDIRYNETIMPNLLNHQKQEDASLELHQFSPLVKVQCSPDLQFFLCSMYVPVCTILEKALPPCRSLCESAKSGCESLMNKFGFNWPESLSCHKFPEAGTVELCVGETDRHPSAAGPEQTAPAQINPLGKRPVAIRRPPNSTRDLGFSCPLQMRTPPGLDYVLQVNGREHKNCGAPCDALLFNRQERQTLRLWIGIWALLCLVSTLFTVLTYAIDRDRFQYPERAIIYLSVCFMCIGLVYIMGFFLGDRVSCNDPYPSPFPSGEVSNVQMVSTVVQGNKKESCTFLFMSLYFFTISSAIWWVILTLTWFLAAGLKWGQEAIESNSHLYHLAGWALPAVMTITVLAMGRMEGDVLSGVCTVGYWNQEATLLFIFVPLASCLMLGLVFLTAGFVSLWRIRTLMKLDGTDTEKLEHLMMRIALFSLLYVCPTVVLLSCHWYERQNLRSWQLTWLNDICLKREFSIPCPSDSDIRPTRPYFSIFFLKYLSAVMAGIASGFWVYSEKTLTEWANFGRSISHKVFRCFITTPSESYV